MPDQDQRVAMSKHPYQPESHHFSLNNLSQIFRGAPHFVFSEKVGLGPLVSEKTKQNTIGESSLDHLVIQLKGFSPEWIRTCVLRSGALLQE